MPAASPAQKAAAASARSLLAPSVIAWTASGGGEAGDVAQRPAAVNQYSGAVMATATAAVRPGRRTGSVEAAEQRRHRQHAAARRR